MKVTNIEWYINEEQLKEAISHISTFRELVTRIKLPQDVLVGRVTNIPPNVKQWTEYVCNQIHHNVIDAADVVGLPIELEVSDKVGTNDEDIANWLTEEYGYCVKNFSLPND